MHQVREGGAVYMAKWYVIRLEILIDMGLATDFGQIGIISVFPMSAWETRDSLSVRRSSGVNFLKVWNGVGEE